ncbi:MAG: glycosyltransferase family 2 protein [Candidatus Edwardsbacteria bacterium]
MNKLSCLVITFNEEKNIVLCLESLAWADEIVVVDAFSEDETFELAKKFTPKVFKRKWEGYTEAKKFALTQTTGDWILWIDADERVTPVLSNEIKKAIKDNSFDAYEMPRQAFFLGKWIKHCGWYPGYVIRLFKKDKARFTDSLVHEGVIISGKVDRLKEPLLHYAYDNLSQYFTKFNHYTTLAAEDYFRHHKRWHFYQLLFNPPAFFLRSYILKLGFLDGMHGLILCFLSAFSVFIKYAKLWERERRH